MANLSTMLIAMFMGMFWLFRAIVAICSQFSIDMLGIVTYNLQLEIVILFATIICLVLVIKRKMLGSLIYLLIYGAYFGEHFVASIIPVLQKETTVNADIAINLFIDLIAILIAIFAVMDMLFDKGRKVNPVDKKTDWYFKNKKYDEELEARDSREDKNEYKYF